MVTHTWVDLCGVCTRYHRVSISGSRTGGGRGAGHLYMDDIQMGIKFFNNNSEC